jgi:hypothetical protein
MIYLNQLRLSMNAKIQPLRNVLTVKKLKLGNLLVTIGEITQEQLDHALHWQKENGGKLEVALITIGHADWRQIEKGRHLQSKMIAGFLLVFMGAFYPFIVYLQAGSNSSQAISISATVLPSARMQINYQVSQINITAKDIAQGYVDVQAGSLFTVVITRGTTYFLDMYPRSNIFSSVKIDGLGNQIVLGNEGGTITQANLALRSTTYILNYRFMLKPNLQPDVYDWPLQLAIRVK